MAKVISPEKISGTVGNKTYFTKNGVTYVRQKSSLTKADMLKNGNFAITLKNAGDFGTASRNGSFLRGIFCDELKDVCDAKFHLRLSNIFREALYIKSHQIKQEISFDQALSLPEIRHAFKLLEVNTEYRNMLTCTTNFKPDTQSICLQYVQFSRQEQGLNSTHGYFSCAIAKIDFDNRDYNCVRTQSELFDLDNLPTQIELNLPKLPGGEGSLFLVTRFVHGFQDAFGFRAVKNNKFNNATLNILM